MSIRQPPSIWKHFLHTSPLGADQIPPPGPALSPIFHRISQIPASLISFGAMALYLPPASSRTSALISRSSSFGAKMTRAVLRKRCTVPKSTTAVSRCTSTSRLGKPNSAFLLLPLFLKDCTPDSVQAPPRFHRVLCWWVGISPTLPHYTHTLLVLPFTATIEPAVSTLTVDARRLTAAFVSQQPIHARSRPTSPVRTSIWSRLD